MLIFIAFFKDMRNWPRPKREVLELYFVEGLEAEEIAMVTSRPLKTVRQSIASIPQRLREEILEKSLVEHESGLSRRTGRGVPKALPGELEALKADLASQKDRSLRLAADFDNFRKRTAQEADRRAAEQKEAFIRELLPVIGNLERALANDPSASPQQLREGVQITLQQLKQLLRHHGIEPEDSLGQPFDPHRHEALRVGHDASKPDHTVLEVFQRSYRRGNEVFRPAKVVVNDLSDAGSNGFEG